MRTLFPHQEVAAELGVRKNLLLTDECGLGKTLSAIEIIRRLRAQHSHIGSLVICPKSTRYQWLEELLMEDIKDVTIVDSDETIDELFATNGVGIIHYEAMLKYWVPLHRRPWQVIVCDEAHRIKNKSAQRTRAVKRLQARRLVALTGTPIERSPADLWSILNWLYPEAYSNYFRFEDNYVDRIKGYNGPRMYWKIVGGRNLETLAKEILPFTLHRVKSDIGGVPEKVVSKVRVNMEKPQKALYDRVRKQKDIELDLTDVEGDYLLLKNQLSRLMYLQMAASMPQLLGEGLDVGNCKLQWLADYIEDNPDEVVCVFTRFRRTATMISETFGFPLFMGGSDPGVISDFQRGVGRGIVGTTAGMGEGLNLQRAGTAVFFETDWSSTKIAQAMDRIHRIGSVGTKNIIFLSAAPVDELIIKAVDRKWTERELLYAAQEEGVL